MPEADISTPAVDPHPTSVELQLARRFHTDTATAMFVHPLIAVILGLFLWGYVDNRLLLSSLVVVSVASFARFLLHRAARVHLDDADLLRRRTRLSTVLPAAAWGGVALVLISAVPEAMGIRILLLVAGLVAAGTATHMADRIGFHLFTASILVPAGVGIVVSGPDRHALFDLLIIAAYWATMALIQTRGHAQLETRLSIHSQVEAASRSSAREKEFLDSVLTSIPDGMALVDLDDHITRMNAEFQDVLVPGNRDGPLTVADVAGSGLGAVLAGAIRDARSDGFGERECRTSADGETRWFIATASRASGQAEGWILLQIRDITGLRSAQDALKKAEADYAAMVESAHDLIWRVDARGRWIFLNAAAQEVYGAPRHHLLGTPLLDRSAPEQVDADRNALKSVFDGGTLVNHVTVHHRFDGEERWMSFSASPLRDATDAVVGAHGIARDVTAEVKAREALEELARRNSLVRSLINVSDDMVFYKGVDLVYKGSNHAFSAFFDLDDDDDLAGRTDYDLFPEELAAASRARDREVMDRRTAIRYEAHYDIEAPHRVWETVETPYVSDDGEVLGVLGIAREMTAWKQAQERIEGMAEEAERAARMKSAFLANMSHEIRTPMNGVLGMSELLQDTPLSSEQRQYVDVIRSSADNLLRILNDILDFSKIEAGRLSLDAIPFNLHKEIGDAVRVLAIPASRRGNELMVDIAADVPCWVEGDPGRLRQILTNLVGNAVKFTQDGEVEVGVRRLPTPEGEPARVRIQVRDSGIGIAEDKLTLIFQEFSQADVSVSRRYGGTGLGLAISRKLVNMMGGEMTLESKENEGSTFTFDVILPSCEPPAEARPLADRGPVDLTGVRVMVVDDNQTNRRILRGVLRESGALVHLADSGAAALDRLDELDAARTPPDLIVMDVQMPEMDGLEVVQRLRTHPDLAAFAQIPVLVLTSANRSEDTQRVRDLGIEGYFLKPLPRPDLLRAVAAIQAERDVPVEPVRGTVRLGAHLHQHRILVVEDNPVNRMVACATLEKAGYRVEVATNGLEAVIAVRDDEFQLVLMDIQMPEMDGLEATRAIREMEQERGGRRLPIVALTAHALAEERERCLASGMDDFLAKPFRAEELLTLLEHWTRSSSDDTPDDAGDEPMLNEPSTASPPTDSFGPAVDVEAFREVLRTAGIEEVLEPTLQVFRADLPKRAEAIHAAWADSDVLAVAEVAHAIKSAAGNVQAHRLNRLVADLEAAGRADDRSRMEELWPDVAAELIRVDAFLQNL